MIQKYPIFLIELAWEENWGIQDDIKINEITKKCCKLKEKKINFRTATSIEMSPGGRKWLSTKKNNSICYFYLN